MAIKLRQLSFRDLFAVILPAVLIAVLAFWAAAQFIKPAPPRTLAFSSGGEGSGYQRFAARYREILARYDINLVEMPSAGSIENLARLRDGTIDVDAGFVQGGTAHAVESDTLQSLGAFFEEPLWIFYRANFDSAESDDTLTELAQLKGRRVAIGLAGSGTQHLALELLSANGIDRRNARLIEDNSLDLGERLRRGRLDAVFVVGPTESALVWSLLYTPGVKLMSLTHAEAYTRRMRFLERLILPRGAIDLVRDIPPQDVQLVSPVSTVMVRSETHPALIGLLMQAATEVHGEPGVFQRSGEFPRTAHGEFPLAAEATRYFNSGKPLLQRYLPFWAATLADRLVVMLVPIIAILFPLFRLAPTVYGWRVRSRIYRHYGELKFLESELQEAPERHTREEWMEKLDGIEAKVNQLPTPLAFADMLYTLREHIGLVRSAMIRRDLAG